MGIQQALVTVTGNLGADPVPFTTGAGVPACSFRLGVTPRFYDQNAGQWRDRGTSWVGVCAYRSLAKNILGSLNKGDPAIVTGTLRVERWQKDGADRSSPVIDASAVGPDLSQGIARINKLNRNQPSADASANGGGAGGVAPPANGGMPANGSVPANGIADPMNPAIPPNRASMGAAVAGVTIDTSGVGGGVAGAAATGDATGNGNGAGAPVGSATSVSSTSGDGGVAVDPSTGEMREPGEPDEPDDFDTPAM